MKDEGLRLEFTERFIDMTDEEIDAAENLKQKLTYAYRRIYPRISDIAWPAEIPGKKAHCKLIFWDGTEAVIKESYDDVCNRIDEREKLLDQYCEGEQD